MEKSTKDHVIKMEYPRNIINANKDEASDRTWGDIIVEQIGKILEDPLFWVFVGLGIVAVTVKHQYEADQQNRTT